MTARLNYAQVAPKALHAILGLQKYINDCGLEHSLQELVKIRASQINHCGYCLDMHTKDARALGETEQRIYLLSNWREAPFYTPRERAALAWTEAVTLLSEGPIDDALYAQMLEHFTEEELVNLTMAVITINGWNRLGVPFQVPVGSYKRPESAPKKA